MVINIVLTLLAIPALAFANRLRGTGDMLGALAFVFAFAFLVDFSAVNAFVSTVTFAAAAAVCYFIWDLSGPWGRWFTMNNLPRAIAGPPGVYERIIESIAGSSDHVALAIRMFVACVPFMAMGYYFSGVHGAIVAAVLPFAMVAGYHTAWKLYPLAAGHIHQIKVAEYITGGLWAVAFSVLR